MKKNQQKKKSNKNKEVLSSSKKKIFWFITVFLPVLLLFFLEIVLRIFNYGGNLDLFIDGPEGREKYYTCNLKVAERYFQGGSVPTPPLQLFLKEKPENGYRIFVLGGSSAAGFPYSTNASFPGVLRRTLSETFPEKHIEVVNISMSAVNSYTLLDLLPEVIEKSPDLILIYAGHNEYYGALGVGSVQSLGNSRWLIRTYLNLQSIRTVRLVKDIIGWVQVKTGNIINEENEIDPTNTLMAKIVSEQTIPYGSDLYQAGVNQFKENLGLILAEAKGNDIPVLIGELVSNLRDQEPFISVESENNEPAESVYEKAKQYEKKGEYEKAKEFYTKAKDLDALRFRAPEQFNDIIRELGVKYSFTLVPTKTYFEKASPNGIIGENFMLEHLHPNKDGYSMLAKAFFETMQTNNLIDNAWNVDSTLFTSNKGVTELDSVYASLVVRHLKEGWPFKPKSDKNLFFQAFKPKGRIEEIAFRVMQSENFNLEAAHMELGKYYEARREYEKAFNEYYAILNSIPQEIEFYEKAARVLIQENQYEKAAGLLKQSIKYKPNDFAFKWIGQIALMNGNYEEAITYLSKANQQDDQVIFNLSRAFFQNEQWHNGELYYNRLKRITSNQNYVLYLTKLRAETKPD